MNCKVCDNTAAKCPNVSFFRFPSENARCRDWAERCNILDMYNKFGTSQLYKSFRICSEHFDPKYIIFDGRKKRLLYCAVPEIFEVKDKNPIIRKENECESVYNDYDSTIKLKLVKNLCRLCAEENRNLTDIFGFRGKSLELEKKMQFLPIAITSNDVLPSRVCHSCLIKINEVYNFISNCVKAETKLKIMLDLEGCETSYKVLKCDKILNTESLPKNLTDLNLKDVNEINELPLLLSESKGDKELQDKVYVLPVDQSFNYDQLLQKMEIKDLSTSNEFIYDVPEFDNEVENVLENSNCQSDNSQIIKEIYDSKNSQENTSLEKYNFISVVKEVDFSGYLSLEHDYSNLLKQDVTQTQDNLCNDDSNTNQLYKCKKGIKYSCNVCLKTFSTEEILECHSKAHLLKPSANGKFVCKSCNKIFSNRYRLNEHIRVHTGECPFHCTVCPKSFHKFSLLKQHSIIHNPEKPYFCSICNMRSSRRGNLIQHIKSHYKASRSSASKSKTYLNFCKTCLLVFPTVEDLRHHDKSCHFENDLEQSNQQGFMCEICLEFFPTVETYDRHSVTHGPLHFTCGLCRKQLESLKCLKIHFKHHNSEPKYLCQYCERSFRTREVCLTHERTHTGEVTHECKECGKTFRSRPSFHQHRTVHSEKRLFSCKECGMSFKRKDTLNNHSRIHTGERPFACQICGFAFKQRGDCMKHEKNHKKKEEVEVQDDFSNFNNIEELNQPHLSSHIQSNEHDGGNTWEDRNYITLSSYTTIETGTLSLENLHVSSEHDISLPQTLLEADLHDNRYTLSSQKKEIPR